jgi:alkylation response protein AidB-like acyl-CoA dehydrogenase
MRTNGSLALGVAGRCARLLGSTALDERLADCRAALDEASIDEMPAARAAAGVLAVEAAAALVASGGGRSIVRDHHAQRLARESMFLLVQGQTPTIRVEQRRSLGL